MHVCCDIEVEDEIGKYLFWSDIYMYVALSYICVCVYMHENRRVKSDAEVEDEGGKYPFRSDICMYVALSYIHMWKYMYVCSFIINKGICVAKYMYMCCDVEVDDEGGKYRFWSDICTYVALSYMHMWKYMYVCCLIVYTYVRVYICTADFR